MLVSKQKYVICFFSFLWNDLDTCDLDLAAPPHMIYILGIYQFPNYFMSYTVF